MSLVVPLRGIGFSPNSYGQYQNQAPPCTVYMPVLMPVLFFFCQSVLQYCEATHELSAIIHMYVCKFFISVSAVLSYCCAV